MRLLQGTIKRFGGALLVCGGTLVFGVAAGAAIGSKSACSPAKSAWSFVSAPALHPMRVHVCTRKKHEAPGMIFVAPFHNANGAHPKPLVGQAGALMLDQGGDPVWFHPAGKGQIVGDFKTQQWAGQPVLTFWQGKIAIPPHITNLPPGSPVSGALYVYNDHYQLVKTIKAHGSGWVTDFHDFVITPPTTKYPEGTALFLAAKKESGGAPGGFEDEEIQEVNMANPSGPLVWSWDVHKFIGAHTSRVHPPPTGAWDPYHANSLDIRAAGGNPAGEVLLSLRNTWGIYAISHANNKILWKLINGKGSTYKLSKSARFYWQHDVHFHGAKQLTIFDDECCNLGAAVPKGPARGLLLSLNGNKTATVVRQYHHPNTALVPTLGSMRYLADGHAFIGWGQSPYYSEYTGGGTLLYDVAMPQSNASYRTLKAPWVGLPLYPPSAAAKKVSGKIFVYASWNGATKVAKWKVLAGKTSATVITPAGSANRSGFETAIHATNSGPWYVVQALDSHGVPIPGGTSKPVKLK